MVKARWPELALAVVKDLRVARAPATAEDLEALETDVLAGFVLARAAAGLSDGTISSDVMHLEQVRAWFGRPLWEMEPATPTCTSARCCAAPPGAPACRERRRSRPTSCSSI
ncbi:hypothetical protein [Nonomuraea sp. NPDC049141]|uniref:hypothetical protein n=1 Tax=Nonomuraea sp. NPDC049141 TaxID=3155500 RepID=UPI00340140DC